MSRLHIGDNYRIIICYVLYIPMCCATVTKAQQLLQGLQSKDEGQQVSAVMEMCQVYQVDLYMC